jgi:AAA+ ATPase superfamily predicted ATPase
MEKQTLLKFKNPFRPGAGHQPPYLAGRTYEIREFQSLLDQDIVSSNLIITGLRGVGKTVLLESLRPLAQQKNWLWVGTDCSESISVDEHTMAVRILTDIALITSGIKIKETILPGLGFNSANLEKTEYMDFDFLAKQYSSIPGLPSDKLKTILLFVWKHISTQEGLHGIVFAYDEAQTLSDHAKDKQYPLALLLDLFQFLQKNSVRFLLVLTGLPMLLSRLIETRTYTERMFRVLVLEQLNESESRDAILKPIEDTNCPIKFDAHSVDVIASLTGGYPYFIQFICREVYDVFEQQIASKQKLAVPVDAIIQKLDNDFFAGRWSRATDREKELLTIIARNNLKDFGIMQVVELSQQSNYKAFSKSQLSQMLRRLIENGLVYKNRRGEYSFAVPLLEQYINRTQKFTEV